MQRILFINDQLNGGETEKLIQFLVRSWHAWYEITIMTEEYQEGFYEFYPNGVQYITAKPASRMKGQTALKSVSNLKESITAEPASHKKERYTPSKDNFLKSCIYKFRQKHHDRRFHRQTAPGTFDIIFCMKKGWLMENYYYLRAPLRYVWVHTDSGTSICCHARIHSDSENDNHFVISKAMTHDNEDDARYDVLMYNDGQSENYTVDNVIDNKHELAIMKTYTGIICSTQDIKANIIKTIGDPGNLLVRYDPLDIERLFANCDKNVEP